MFALGNITFDCTDPRALAEFWSQATGWEIKESGEFMARVARADDRRPHFLFLRVPESKTAKNRVHLDFGVGDIHAEVARLESLGATRGESHREAGFRWTVLADPEGNEFCVGHPDQT